MAASATTEGTEAPGGNTGLPQFNTETFPSQIFWLVVTFGLLFLFLWKKTLPMIAGAISERRNRVEGDLGAAEDSRKGAADALQAYETALAQARARAHALADENRKRIVAEID
jgi:F-type H+-transporting ATPase subunit b